MIAESVQTLVNALVRWSSHEPRVCPEQIVATSSGFSVVNADTKTAESDPDDPVQYALSATPTKVFPFDTTNRSFIDLYHLFVGTQPAAGVTVVAFGFIPLDEGGKGIQDPHQLSASYPVLSDIQIGGGFWIPLTYPKPSGEHQQTFSTTPEVISDYDSPGYKLAGGVSYGCVGCKMAVVLVKTASTDPTVGCVLAKVAN